MAFNCRLCRNVRLVLLSVVLGGVAGFAVIRGGGSTDLSMVATFFGALVPVVWHVRRHRAK